MGPAGWLAVYLDDGLASDESRVSSRMSIGRWRRRSWSSVVGSLRRRPLKGEMRPLEIEVVLSCVVPRRLEDLEENPLDVARLLPPPRFGRLGRAGRRVHGGRRAGDGRARTVRAGAGRDLPDTGLDHSGTSTGGPGLAARYGRATVRDRAHQHEHAGRARRDEATTLAYFFEIVANTRVLIGTYQHRFRRSRTAAVRVPAHRRCGTGRYSKGAISAGRRWHRSWSKPV